MNGFICFLRWLFLGERPKTLAANTPTLVRLKEGERKAQLGVSVLYKDGSGSGASRAHVRFQVRVGEVRLAGKGLTEAVVATNQEGVALVDVEMAGGGYAVIVATLEGVDARIRFAVRAPGVPDQLSVYCEPVFDATAGEVKATVIAVDCLGQPVDANLQVALQRSVDQVVRGTAKATEKGIYQITVPTNLAGDWTLKVKDRSTRVAGERNIHIRPGPPVRIELSETVLPDPRHEPPYDRVTIRVRLVDSFGNPLDPRRISGAIDNQKLPGTPIGSSANFTVTKVGYQDVSVKFSDTGSEIQMVQDLYFAAAWMSGRGVARPGSNFTLPVYLQPPPDRSIRKATIEIRFDRERAKYVGLGKIATPGGMASVTPLLEEDRLLLEVAFPKEISAEEFPTGIPVCGVEWTCTGPGRTCFISSATMSPSSRGWTLCMEQKHEIPNRRCVCTNVIYRASHPSDRLSGRDMVRQAMRAITANDYQCCPHLFATIHEYEISDEEWENLGDLWLSDEPQDWSDLQIMYDLGHGQRENCLNIYAIPIDSDSLQGYADTENNACATVDLEGFTRIHNLATHEIGHLLGLTHRSQPGNIMSPGDAPYQPGNYLATDQCRTIWEALDDYPCS